MRTPVTLFNNSEAKRGMTFTKNLGDKPEYGVAMEVEGHDKEALVAAWVKLLSVVFVLRRGINRSPPSYATTLKEHDGSDGMFSKGTSRGADGGTRILLLLLLFFLFVGLCLITGFVRLRE